MDYPTMGFFFGIVIAIGEVKGRRHFLILNHEFLRSGVGDFWEGVIVFWVAGEDF